MDCQSTTVKELRALCKKRGVRGCYKLRKKELCKKLELPPVLGDAAEPSTTFTSRKCKPPKTRGSNDVWSKTELLKMCKEHKIDACSASMRKAELCDVLAGYFAEATASPKGMTSEERFNSKDCRGRKSATSWGKDELLELLKEVGLPVNKSATKTQLCNALSQFFEAQRELSLGEAASSDDDDISKQVDSVLTFMSGLVWLLKKHRGKVCVPLNPSNVRSPRFGQSYCHYSLCWYAAQDSMRWGFSKEESVWWDTLERWCHSSKRFAAVPLYITGTDGKKHMNFIIVDTERKTMERFEPNGYLGDSWAAKVVGHDSLEDLLTRSAKAHGYTYIPTIEFCPRVGPQALENAQREFTKIGDPSGFCSFWSLWYADRRLRYPDMSQKKLLEGLMDTLARKGNLKKFIRSFANFIDSVREGLTEKAKMYQSEEQISAKTAVTEVFLMELLRD